MFAFDTGDASCQKEVRAMKKFLLSLALAFLMVIPLATQASATSICIDQLGFCNDHFLVLQPGASGVYGLHGYEYGCGSSDTLLFGSMRLAGGYAYLGTGVSAGSVAAHGLMSHRNFIVNLATYTGTYVYIHYDEFGPYGGVGDCAINMCASPPVAAQALEPSDVE